VDSSSLGITSHLIKEGIARLEEIKDPDGKLQNLYIRVDKSPFFHPLLSSRKSQIDRAAALSHGKAAAGKLLVELQVRKSTADGAGAREFYTNLTTPPPEWEGEIRNLVLKKKQVRGYLAVAEGEFDACLNSPEKCLCNRTLSSSTTKSNLRSTRSPGLAPFRVLSNESYNWSRGWLRQRTASSVICCEV
jgi:hypothetical protein